MWRKAVVYGDIMQPYRAGNGTATRPLCCCFCAHSNYSKMHVHRRKRKWRKVIEVDGEMCRNVLRSVLQRCGAVLHDDGWGRKWQHKWLLKRGNGGIYKNYVRLCLRPMSHIILGYCVLRPDLCDFPALHMGQALLKLYVILLSKKQRC